MHCKNPSLTFAASSVILLLSALLLSAEAQAYAYKPPEGREGAECMVRVAEGARLRLGALINATEANEAAMRAIRDAGLMEAFKGNVSLYVEGAGMLAEAKARLSSGDYDGAVSGSVQAMKAFREAFRGIVNVLEAAGLRRGELLRAQGLAIAAERALERIRRVEEALPEGAEDVRAMLEQAKLCVAEATQALQRGDAADAAKKLAEANRLINEAFAALKARAEENMAERMSRFCERLACRFRELMENMAGNGPNASALLREHDKFQESLNRFRENAQKEKGRWRSLLPGLRELQLRLEELMAAVQPKDGTPAIEVSVEKTAAGSHPGAVRLKVTVANVGNATVQFPNSVYGVTVERREGSAWVPAYSPISAQVTVELKPGQAGRVEVVLPNPRGGEYRVRVRGWVKADMTPVEAAAELSIP